MPSSLSYTAFCKSHCSAILSQHDNGQSGYLFIGYETSGPSAQFTMVGTTAFVHFAFVRTDFVYTQVVCKTLGMSHYVSPPWCNSSAHVLEAMSCTVCPRAQNMAAVKRLGSLTYYKYRVDLAFQMYRVRVRHSQNASANMIGLVSKRTEYCTRFYLTLNFEDGIPKKNFRLESLTIEFGKGRKPLLSPEV